MDDKYFLKLALQQAKKSVEKGGFPTGAIIVKDGKVIAEGISIGNILHDPTSHAETVAVRTACEVLKTSDLTGSTLYESLECCTMCFSVCYWAGISKIVYAARKTPDMIKKMYYEGTTSNTYLSEHNNRQIKLVFIPNFEEESLNLVKQWEEAL